MLFKLGKMLQAAHVGSTSDMLQHARKPAIIIHDVMLSDASFLITSLHSPLLLPPASDPLPGVDMGLTVAEEGGASSRGKHSPHVPADAAAGMVAAAAASAPRGATSWSEKGAPENAVNSRAMMGVPWWHEAQRPHGRG